MWWEEKTRCRNTPCQQQCGRNVTAVTVVVVVVTIMQQQCGKPMEWQQFGSRWGSIYWFYKQHRGSLVAVVCQTVRKSGAYKARSGYLVVWQYLIQQQFCYFVVIFFLQKCCISVEVRKYTLAFFIKIFLLLKTNNPPTKCGSGFAGCAQTLPEGT